ncbi:flagellar biosynthesis protein FlgB [Pseudoflavonifractor sp. 60]|uniref:flagellar basal body rod protein FlgB n=1 Tax=Pseudoflavonifractor sp. 60 TaxID=2304576 RepID=UPI001367D2EC|nr:flagellar biosynthesis protein FlgB [Pseudoflavonifractor sp. 60]MCI8914677.1 flagellar biosynthesis protein FlgB [Lawsonibacter sp.]NBI67876.1 flagellar biosynthesis protein FlgB [Pseudoflavonifractor sp. 60]
MSMLYTNSLMMLERAMNYQWTKFNAISDNIVNAETPNYKAKYVTFEEALDSSIRSAQKSPSRKISSVRSAIDRAQPIVHVAENESMRMDENGVNVAEQETEATRTVYQMQYTMDAINSNLSLMRTLIRGQ